MAQPTKPVVTPVWASTATDNVTPTDAFIASGWPLSTTPPSRGRFNWLLNYLYNGIRYFSRRGIADYDAAETYITNDRTMGPDGLTYVSLVDNNVGNTPASSPTQWARWALSQTESDTRYVKHGTGALAGTQSNIGWTPSAASSDVRSVTFTAPCAGLVRVSSTINSGAGQTATITNVAAVNGVNGGSEAVAGSSTVYTVASVASGASITVTATASVTTGTAIPASHWLTYEFLPS